MNHHTHHFFSVMAAKLFVLALAGGASTITTALQTPLDTGPQPGAAKVKSIGTAVIQTTKPAELERALNQQGLEVADEVAAGRSRTYVEVDVSVSDSRLQQVGREKDAIIIGDIAPNLRYGALLTPNDTNFSAQWNLSKISAPAAWDTSTGSESVTIAVVDTGVLSSQAWGSTGPFNLADLPASKLWNNTGELGTTTLEGPTPNCTSRGLALNKNCNNRDDDSNGFIDDWRGWDFMGGWRGTSGGCPNYADPSTYNDPDYPNYVTEDNDPQPYSCDDYSNPEQLNKDHYNNGCGYGTGACVLGHGTAVSSIAASSSNNNALIAGVDWNAKIMPLRTLDGYGMGNSSQIAASIDYAVLMKADVINLSLAMSINGDCNISDTLVDGAMQRAVNAGIVIVAASGNNGDGTVCYPARSPLALAIGASDSNDARASFSSYGPELDLVAPGSAVPTANAPSKAQSGTYDSAAYGTSFAAPHVAGAAAIMIALHPEASSAEIRDELRYSSDKVLGMNGQPFTNTYGYGRLNLNNAIAMNSNLAYVPLDKPREMWLVRDLTKTDLLTLDPVGPNLDAARIIRFTTKTYVDGKWYLRTAYDTGKKYHFGIPLDYLRDLPAYRRLDKPRDMKLKNAIQKTHLLTKNPTGGTLAKGRIIRFETKTYLKDGIWYLRTVYDSDRDIHYGIPLSQLAEL